MFRRPQPAPPPVNDRLATAPIHVTDSAAHIRLDDGLLSIERPDAPPLRLRLPEVQSLSLHGRAGLSTPCLHALLEEGIPVIWRSATGYYLGQTADLSGHSAAVRRVQYAAQDTPLALALARRLVGGKVANMHAVLRRRAVLGPSVQSAAAALPGLAARAAVATDLDTLRGFEGAAAATYFGCWPTLLKGRATAVGFPGRTRRPPRDPINAALSYCYAVLTGECAAAALAAGLDPAAGFLHAARAGRPALALDLVEPFRPLVADAAVLFAMNSGELDSADFADGPDGIRLSDSGRRTALGALERRLESHCSGTGSASLTYRTAIGRLADTDACAPRERSRTARSTGAAMSDPRLYLVAYDIAAPRRWRRVYKTLCRAGEHAQLSVFLCRLRPERMARLEMRIRQLIDPATDRLMVIDLGRPDAARQRLRGNGSMPEGPWPIVL